MKDGFKGGFLPLESRLYTVGQLRTVHRRNSTDIFQNQGGITAKERRIRDIDALFGVIQTIRKLKPVQQEYEGIHWNGKREKVQSRTWRRIEPPAKSDLAARKLMKSLELASHLDKEQRAAPENKAVCS